MLAVRFRRYRPLFLLLKQALAFTVLPTYTAPKHPPNSPLVLVLDAVGVKELLRSNLPRTPLSLVIAWVYPRLVALTDLVPLLIGPILMLLCPRKPEDLIRR